MKDRKKNHGKRAIIQDIMAKGVSAKRAAKALDAVIDAWKFALWSGEEVELPVGTLQPKIVKGSERITLQTLRNISSKELRDRLVHFPGRRRVVKLKHDPALKLPLDPPRSLQCSPSPPQPSETAEESAQRQLASELLGRPADQETMTILRNAVGAHPRIPGTRLMIQPKPGALLRRLQNFKARGGRVYTTSELSQQISECYWL